MDKELRNQLAKSKQQKRLKFLKDPTWMDESDIGKLKNHPISRNCKCDYCKIKYKRPKSKKIDPEEFV